MRFTNPLTSIESVTVSVPTLTRDLWYWPCVTGESFPPTLSASSGYSSQSGLACVQVAGSGVSTGTASWPVRSRYLDTAKTATVAFLAYGSLSGLEPSVATALEIATNVGIGLSSTAGMLTLSAGSWSGQINEPASGEWHSWTITGAADGSVTFTLDGATVGAAPAGSWPLTDALEISVQTQTSQFVDIAELQVSYS